MAVVLKDTASEHSEILPEIAEKIQAHLEKAQKAFSEWAADPSHKLRLDMPHEALRAFIPQRVYELAEDPDKVDVGVFYQDEKGIQMAIFERKSNPLTNEESLGTYKQELGKVEEQQGEGKNPEDLPIPADVDEMHVETLEPNSPITINDFIFNTVDINIINGNQLHVDSFRDRKEIRGKGAAKEFYKDCLRHIAKNIGARFITGLNNEKNLWFFTGPLGRLTLNQLRPDVRGSFINLDDYPENYHKQYFDDPPKRITDVFTVDFLYPEDVARFIQPQRQTARAKLRVKAGYAS